MCNYVFSSYVEKVSVGICTHICHTGDNYKIKSFEFAVRVAMDRFSH